MFREEKRLYKKGYKIVVGLDEAGRGPLAGPVVAGAVLALMSLRGAMATKQSRGNTAGSPRSFYSLAMTFRNIKDSKKLSEKQREEWYKILTNHPDISWGVGVVSEKIIDKINILKATKLAMLKAVCDLERKIGVSAEFLIIDGNFVLSSCGVRPRSLAGSDPAEAAEAAEAGNALKQKAIIKADEKVFSCTAASIIAKVTRDRLMRRLHKKYPQYGFDRHKGYGTKGHLRALRKYGPCEIHRKSFGPVKKITDN